MSIFGYGVYKRIASNLASNNIRNFGFSALTLRDLRKAGIYTTDQLKGKSDIELLKINNFGPTSLQEIRRVTEPSLPLNHLERLGLQARTLNTLKRGNINSIDELERKSDEELLSIKTLGRMTLQEIRQKLGDYWSQ